jgi:hypothetical protein
MIGLALPNGWPYGLDLFAYTEISKPLIACRQEDKTVPNKIILKSNYSGLQT